MSIVISLLAIFGLAFTLKETNGPWDLISKWRNLMMRIPFIGVQFYKLLDCYFCTGWWCGIVIYLLSNQNYTLSWAIVWGLAGGVICLLMDGILNWLHKE
jgi:hypothetical protein